MTWSVCSMTSFAIFDGFLILRMEATEPHRRVGPCITRCIEFDNTVFVRQTAISDRGIFGIVFLDVDAGDHGIERVRAGTNHLECPVAGPQSVGTGDDDFACPGLQNSPRSKAPPSPLELLYE